MAVVRLSGWQLQAARIFRAQRVMLPALAVFLLLASVTARSQVSCTGLCLQQTSCGGGGTTSISGTVYAPNGTDPLPNVLVYIPNIASVSALPALPQGVECNPNGEPALGAPLVSTVTAVNGTFTLTNVPVGANIPLVIQAGKWRRIFTVPNVASCTNTLASTASGSGTDTTAVPAGHNIHLPQNQGEGDIPKIAIVTGAVDGVECVLSKMGVATSEFTDPTGTGRINLYLGDTLPGVNVDNSTPLESALESSQANLNKYDLVMLPCQGEANTSLSTQHPNYLTNLGTYANSGGRIYATHYSYDLLDGNSAFAGAVNWNLTDIDPADQNAYINTANPQGADLSAWLQLVDPQLYPPMGTLSPGEIPVNTIRDDVGGIPSTTQSFLSITNPGESIQFTFPTPVTSPAASQCGRVLFNQYHVEDFDNNHTTGKTFPAECSTTAAITPQEQLLEYSLFDLGTFTSPSSNPTVSISFTNTPTTLTQGDTADTAAITVTNTSTTTATNATLQVAVTMPAGLTATSIAPAIPATSGWTCTLGTLTCTRTTGLNASSSDAIVVTFNVAANASSPQTISATVSNGNLAAPVTATDALVIPLTLSPASEPLPNASYGVAYSQQFTAGGGDAPYSYGFSGTLPPGLSLNSATGLLSGTPTTAADGNTYNFNVIVTDSASKTVSQSYSIVVPQLLASSTLTVASAANPTPGSAITVPAGATVTATYTLTDTAGLPIPIPAGTSIVATTPSTTAIFGTPAINGGTLTETVSDTAAESLTLGVYNLGVPIYPATASATFVPPAYVVTVNTDEASGNGVASNCVDPNLPTYSVAANANCGLRDAVAAANALSGVTTNIGFSLPNPSTIMIAQTGGITITQNVNINGPGANQVTIEGGNTPLSSSNNPILRINNGNVSISGLTFANGYAGSGYNGGAINFNETGSGSLTVSNSTFTGNLANNGGALSANYLTVSNSTFTGNYAVYGGAVFSTLLTVSNSTFSGNSVQSGGGAIATMSNLRVSNSIFSGNSASEGSGIYALKGGTATSIVYYGDTFNGVTPTSSINADPKLSPLGSYGGPTPTLLPLPGSAAICAGTVPTLNSVPLTTDQRGVAISGARYGQSACYDVGAVQTQYDFSATFNVPSLVTLGSPVTPAPVATVTENGTPLTAGPATVNMTDTGLDLSPSATVSVATSTTSGQATFSNLLFTNPEVTDTLTATLPLNSNLSPAISLSAASNSFQVGQLPQTITNFNPPATATYGQAPITLSATGGASGNPVTFKVTNGGPGLISGNQLTITGAGTIKVEADQAGNTVYSAANPVTAYIVVSPAVLTVTIVGNPTKVYDGTTAATLTSANYQVNGVVSPDVITVTQPTGTYAAATAGPETVTAALPASSFSAAPGSLNNYTLPASATGTGTILQAPLTATAGSYNGQYDGGPHAVVPGCNVSTNFDGITCTNSVSSVGPDVSSGVVTPVIHGPTANYNVISYNGSWNITPRSVVLTAGSLTGTYNGSAQTPSACTSSYGGVTCTNNPASVGPGSGSGTIAPVQNIVIGIPADYVIAGTNGSYSIAQATSITSISCPPSVVYNGSARTPCTATATGAGNFSTSVPVTYTLNTNVGTATASATFTGDANHTGSSNSTTFTIALAPVTAQAGVGNAVYDGNTHSPSACTVTGAYTGNLTCTNSPATVGPGVVNTTVVPVVTGSNLSNFEITPVNGSFTINQAASVTKVTCPASVTYTGAAQTPCTAVVTGAGGLSQSLPVTYTLNLHAGTATASASYSGDTNHAASNGSTTFVINKATPVITWPTPASFTYGTPISATQLNATASYLGSPVAGTFVYTAETGPNPLGVLLPPGTTALSATITPTDSVDFNSATAYVVFTVSKAQTTTTLAVTTAQTVTGTTATLTATVKPQIGGTPTGTVTYYVGSTVLGSAAVGTPFTTGVLPVGSNSITAVYGGDANFVGSSSSASAVVSVAPTTVQLTSPLSRVFYPGSAVSFTVIVPLKNLQLISGTITLYDGNTVIGTYSLPAGGILVGITPQLGVGTHSLRAVYGGNGQYPPGQSPVVTVTVAAL